MSSSAPACPEQPLFFQSAHRQIYGLLGSPASASNLREGVIFCAPAPYEVKKFHWTQRQLAQRLQMAGYHTLRFDYFATGDSEGESRDFDLNTCRVNIQDAIQYMKSSGLIRRVSLVATRLACPLALQAVATERVRKLILIDPVLDGKACLAEAQAMQEAMLELHLRNAPSYAPSALYGQLLGIPHQALLLWQLQNLECLPATIKAKAATIISSQGLPDPTGLMDHLTSQLEEVQHMRVSDNLKWGNARALQFQDFPNQLIHTAISAIRGAL
jgi:pimeloyl-ACP methyl ester carboxylesterase